MVVNLMQFSKNAHLHHKQCNILGLLTARRSSVAEAPAGCLPGRVRAAEPTAPGREPVPLGQRAWPPLGLPAQPGPAGAKSRVPPAEPSG